MHSEVHKKQTLAFSGRLVTWRCLLILSHTHCLHTDERLLRTDNYSINAASNEYVSRRQCMIEIPITQSGDFPLQPAHREQKWMK